MHLIVSDEKSQRFPNISYKLGDGSGCRVYKNTPPEFAVGGLTISQTYWMPDLSDAVKSKYHLQNYTVFLSREYFEWYCIFYNDYDLLINELLDRSHFNISTLEVKLGEEIFSFRDGEKSSKLVVALKSLLGVLLLEAVSLVYIYSTVVTAPAFLVFVIQYCCCRDALSRYQVYKVFPWLGIYLLPLERSRNASPAAKDINTSILLMFVVVYCIYIGAMGYLWNWIFLLPCRGELRENYCGFIAMMEFVGLLLLRTRSSLKYFPQVFLPCQVAFMTYCSYVEFGFKNLLFTANISLTLCLLCLFLLKIEVPAMTSWNKSKFYTPTENQPRVVYCPTTNVSWANDMPDFWTLCVPLFGRGYFRQEELSVVDQNYELFRNTMAAHELH